MIEGYLIAGVVALIGGLVTTILILINKMERNNTARQKEALQKLKENYKLELNDSKDLEKTLKEKNKLLRRRNGKK